MPISVNRRTVTAGLAAMPLFSVRAGAQMTDVKAAVDSAAREFLTATGAGGVAIGIVTPQGRQLHYYGLADPAAKKAVQADTVFEIGSLSKTFTVALTAVAAAKGALSWDDAPGKHVPEIRGPGTDRLTLRHLATHASGGMPLQFPDDAAKTWDAAAAWYRAWTPAGEPGRVRAYANPSIGLLGVVTARALKGNFTALMRDHVLAPLKLADTFHAETLQDVPAAIMTRYAQGQSRDGKPARLSPGMLAMEAYGLRTTAPDLLRWIEAQVGLAAVPAPLADALKSTHAGWLSVGPMTQGSIWEWYAPPAPKEAVLAGNAESMWRQPNAGEPIKAGKAPPAGALVNKTGGTNGFGVYAAFMPERKLGLVILANRNHAAPERIALAHRIREVVGV